MKAFNLDFTRPDAKIIKAFANIPTATISDAMGRYGTMSSDMKPVFQGARICGPAFYRQSICERQFNGPFGIKRGKAGRHFDY
jgi:hypothetical protein